MGKSNAKSNHFLRVEYFRSLTKEQWLYWGLLAGFVVIATVISSSYSKDSLSYNNMFRVYGASGWGGLATEIFVRETFLLVTTKIIYNLGLGAVFLFLIHAAISLPLKFYLIDRYSKDRFLSLAYFSSYYFLLHDGTQLRFGMAVAFVYLGLHYLANGRRLVFSGIVVLSAILFHNAVLPFLAMLLFTSKRSLTWILGMVVLAIVLYPINYNIFMSDFIGGVIGYFDIEGTRLNKLYAYFIKPSSDMRLGIFSRHGLLIYMFAITIFKYRNVFNKFETLCFNAFLLSIFFWILLKDSMDFQVRLNDMFGFSLVFLIPYVHRRLSEHVSERSAYIFLLLFFSAYLAKFIFYDKMIAL